MSAKKILWLCDDCVKNCANLIGMKELYAKLERFLMPLMLVTGLAVDFITFQTIRIETALTLLSVYFIAAGLAIVYVHLHDAKGSVDRHPVSRFARLIAELIVQFAFGALLSASLVFYWFSGAASVSWPLIIVLAFLMVSNDVFRHYYTSPAVQISVYYFVAFSLLSLILPVAFNSISAWFFLYAGILSLVFILFYLAGISRVVPTIREQRLRIFTPIFIIFVFMNALYAFNLIPPIPLSVRESGVYHDVRRVNGNYLVKAESYSWWQSVWPIRTVHLAAGEKVYVFASIFAPAELNTTITHDWQYFDPTLNEWVSKDQISYPISGGRTGGYRGYTLKSSLTPGRWRVDVKTPRGQVLGRVRFTVDLVEQPPALKEQIL